MKFAVAILLGLLSVSSPLKAASSKNFALEGYVIGFDQKIVTLESGNQKYDVPRALIKGQPKTGDRISVLMTDEQFQKLHHGVATAK